MTAELAPLSYSGMVALRKRGRGSPAAGPCQVSGCMYAKHVPRPRYVYEHCHTHDYIRGIACLECNHFMASIDARVMPDPRIGWTGGRRPAGLLEHWARCPGCAAAGPWEAYLTAAEHEDRMVMRQIISLADELAGLIPPRRQGPDVVTLREQLAALDRQLHFKRHRAAPLGHPLPA